MDVATVSSQLAPNTDSLVSSLSMLATVLGAFFTVGFAVTAALWGYLVWRHNELRKEAEKDIAKIAGFREDAEATKKELNNMASLFSDILNKMLSSFDEIQKEGERVERTLEQVKERKAQISKASASVDTMLAKMRDTQRSLVTVSGMVPDYSQRLSQRGFRESVDESVTLRTIEKNLSEKRAITREAARLDRERGKS